MRRLRDPFWLVPLVVFPLLVFPNLGSAFLWQDEAETALLARATLLHGYPLAHDGRHVISDQPGERDLKDGIWAWSPWLSIYAAAGSLALFGESAWSARLPFVLAAWAVVLLAYAAFQDLTLDRRLSRFATVLLTVSVPLLLHARQCRYYAFLVLFSLLHVWGYGRMVRGGRWAGALVVAGGIGLAQTFLPQLVASTAAFGLHAVAAARDRALLRRLVGASAVVAAVSLPFFVWSASWSRDYEGVGHGYDNLGRFLASLRSYLLLAHAYGFPFLLAALLAWRRVRPRWAVAAVSSVGVAGLGLLPGPLAFGATALWSAALVVLGVAWLVRARGDAARDWRGFSLAAVGATVLLAAAICPFPFYRYLLGVLPLLCLWTASVAGDLVGWRPAWLALAGIVLATTNVVAQVPFVAFTRLVHAAGLTDARRAAAAHRYGYGPANVPGAHVGRTMQTDPPWSVAPLVDYLGEIAHDYDGPVEVVARHLRAHGRDGELLLTSYEHFSLMFHTGLRVMRTDRAGGIREAPDWIFLHSPRMFRESTALMALLASRYERVDVAGKEVPWENIPEPYWHFYRTRVDGAGVALYRRR